VNLFTAAFRVLSAGWAGPLAFARWLVAGALIVGPFLALGLRLSAGLGPRTYRYA